MKYSLMISADVAAQFLSAAAFYDGISDGLGQKLEAEIETTLKSISNFPMMYPVEFGAVRRALIRRFKQVLYYAIRGDSIVVIEMRDARNEPPDWKERGYSDN